MDGAQYVPDEEISGNNLINRVVELHNKIGKKYNNLMTRIENNVHGLILGIERSEAEEEFEKNRVSIMNEAMRQIPHPITNSDAKKYFEIGNLATSLNKQLVLGGNEDMLVGMDENRKKEITEKDVEFMEYFAKAIDEMYQYIVDNYGEEIADSYYG